MQDVAYFKICLDKHWFYQSNDTRHAFECIAVLSGRGTCATSWGCFSLLGAMENKVVLPVQSSG